MCKKNILIFSAAAFLTGVLCFCFKLWQFSVSPLLRQNTKIIVSFGTSTTELANQLQQDGILSSARWFIFLVRLQGAERKLKAGEYAIDFGTTAGDLIKKIITGEVIKYTFTLVEGWTFRQVIKALGSNPHLQHTFTALEESEIMKKIGHPGEHPEGKFAPDTYVFSRGIKDTELLLMAYELMKKHLDLLWLNRSTNLPYVDSYAALIVASLIEKEATNYEEKRLMSGVILNRLAKKMLLQIDPSAIYGLGNKFSGKLRKKDLSINNPYNLYLNKGLPPTPICMPGLDSIRAVFDPAITPYFYYVSRRDGTHEFSTSLREQNIAIKKYLLGK